MEALYRAAVGPKNSGYYVERFLRFDEPGASRVSWNWPSFFIAFWWGLYRRMYGNSFLYCLGIPLCLAIALTLTFAVIRRSPILAAWDVVMLGYSFLVVPLFANSIYHRFILRRIRAVQAQADDPALQVVILENGPHTNNFVSVAFVVVVAMLVPTVGILAAIAIPAYQNYTIRTQVAEGLRLAVPIERAVVASYGAVGHWPSDVAALSGTLSTNGNYVADIRVENGTLYIRYGLQANSAISGQFLTLSPTLIGHSVTWSCGGPATTVAPRFLPQMCRR